jgi:hypothetical protein
MGEAVVRDFEPFDWLLVAVCLGSLAGLAYVHFRL